MQSEMDFQKKAESALEELFPLLGRAAEQYGFDVDLESGALVIEFEEPRAKFVVSPNTPVRQIWLSALGVSYKFDYEESRGAFVLGGSGETLKEVLAGAVSRQLGEPVEL